MLRAKATWYRDHGVAVVWIVIPRTRSVLVLDGTNEVELGPTETLPVHPMLPDLAPAVADFFRQLG